MDLLSTLFSFQGRVSRRFYWLANAASGFLSFVVLTCMQAVSSPLSPLGKGGKDVHDAASGLGSSLLLLVLSLLSMAVGVIALAAQVKRLHDRGRSGYWTLAPLAVLMMLIFELISGVASGAQPMQLIGSLLLWFGILGAINLWFFIELGCLAGKNEPNKYGNPPGSGGGFSPQPGAPSPLPGNGQAAVAAGSLFGAQSAIDRAIAENTRVTPAQAQPSQTQPRPQPRPATPLSPAPAGGAPTFGRRTR